MLERFRNFAKRLELPEDQRSSITLVYRIIDDDHNAVEVSPAEYGRWRMQHDVTHRAVVGEDTVENVMVRTTFSIMPESRGYKPFGTSAYTVLYFDPLLQYSQRYDTWQEADQGHRNTLERIRRDFAAARAVDETAEALAGTAGEVRIAVSEGIPMLFQVHVHSDEEITVHTPLRRPNGSTIDVAITVDGDLFKLSSSASPGAPGGNALSDALRVSVENGMVSSTVQGEDELPRAILRVAQAAASISA